MEPERINVKELVNENLSLLRVNINGKELEVDDQLAAEEPALADGNAVQAIIRNLLSNAIKFTPKGGRISLYSQRMNEKNAFTIKDTGVGMDAATREGLFRIDVRHSSKGTDKEKGSGLGLILCREFVERNGGEITVESEPGAGSMFTFTLPLPGENRGTIEG
jgi:signal transduction histidine kinase